MTRRDAPRPPPPRAKNAPNTNHEVAHNIESLPCQDIAANPVRRIKLVGRNHKSSAVKMQLSARQTLASYVRARQPARACTYAALPRSTGRGVACRVAAPEAATELAVASVKDKAASYLESYAVPAARAVLEPVSFGLRGFNAVAMQHNYRVLSCDGAPPLWL
jgi:hypothetical protein